ncbi:hypothetical protein F2Q70_00012325 [Brassica cretica]|uniref:Uncharacterized protein n=1 Tax=Brassica cretica TaxID=69181 RepID=A0A8S9LXG7_BRACR|nr:hypothetical protein F2Q70_00012325 [Brassica cretica]
MLGGGVASLRFSSVRTAIVMSMHTLPSICLSILSGVWFSDPHEIISTLFFGAGGGELGDSGSVSLFLLFEEPVAFRLEFGILSLRIRVDRWGSILGVRCLFRTTRYSSGFAAACSAAEVVVSSLPCSVRIERSEFLDSVLREYPFVLMWHDWRTFGCELRRLMTRPFLEARSLLLESVLAGSEISA